MFRLSGASLFAVLLGLAALAPCAGAKPPDLPATIERVEPPAPTPELMDAFLRGQILHQQGMVALPPATPPWPSPGMVYPPTMPIGAGIPAPAPMPSPGM